MSDLKNKTVMSTIAGLALCGFLTACGQSDKDTPKQPSLDEVIKQQSVSIGKAVTDMAMAAEANNIKPSEEDCNYMIGSIQAPGVEVSDKVRLILKDRCPLQMN